MPVTSKHNPALGRMTGLEAMARDWVPGRGDLWGHGGGGDWADFNPSGGSGGGGFGFNSAGKYGIGAGYSSGWSGTGSGINWTMASRSVFAMIRNAYNATDANGASYSTYVGGRLTSRVFSDTQQGRNIIGAAVASYWSKFGGYLNTDIAKYIGGYNMKRFLFYNSLSADISLVDSFQSSWSPEQYYDALDGLVLPNGQVISRDNLQLFFVKDPKVLASMFGPKEADIIKNNWKYPKIVSPNALFIVNNNGKFYINFTLNSYEETIANIQAVAVHEIYVHGVLNITSRSKHYLGYKACIDSKYWDFTTPSFKQHTAKSLWEYWNVYRIEQGTPSALMGQKYMEIIRKYDK